jgi:hypothetical protein
VASLPASQASDLLLVVVVGGGGTGASFDFGGPFGPMRDQMSKLIIATAATMSASFSFQSESVPVPNPVSVSVPVATLHREVCEGLKLAITWVCPPIGLPMGTSMPLPVGLMSMGFGGN